MRLIKLIFSVFFLTISSLLSAQEKINITIKASSDLDSGRLDILLFDLGNAFPIEDEIPKAGLKYNRAVRGSNPKLQIIDSKTDSVYVIVLTKKEGKITFSKDSMRDVLHVTTTDGLPVLSDNNVYKDLFNNRKRNPNIKELGMFFRLNPNEINKSDSLRNRLQFLLKDMIAQEFEILKKYPSDYIAFDLFKDQILIFKRLFIDKDIVVAKEFSDFMVTTFSEEIQSTPEFKKTYSELRGDSPKEKKVKQVDMNIIRKDYLNQPFKLSDIKSKYILIDFWATWCGPCMLQIPYIKKLQEDFSSTDLEIIGISADNSLSNLRQGIAENQMSWKHIYDESRIIAEEFKVTAYPTLFLIDREGKIIWSGKGFWETKLDKVREILKQK